MTPTEAAAIAAMYGLLVGLFVYRELSLASLWKCCVESAQTSAVIIMLMAMATIFGNVMTLEQVPERIAAAILDLTSNKIAILLLINVLLLWVGTFMEALAAIVILTPILLPLVTKVGVDPIHFGVIMVVNRLSSPDAAGGGIFRILRHHQAEDRAGFAGGRALYSDHAGHPAAGDVLAEPVALPPVGGQVAMGSSPPVGKRPAGLFIA